MPINTSSVITRPLTLWASASSCIKEEAGPHLQGGCLYQCCMTANGNGLECFGGSDNIKHPPDNDNLCNDHDNNK